MIDFSFVYPAEASRLNYEFPLPPAENMPQLRLFCPPAESVYAWWWWQCCLYQQVWMWKKWTFLLDKERKLTCDRDWLLGLSEDPTCAQTSVRTRGRASLVHALPLARVCVCVCVCVCAVTVLTHPPCFKVSIHITFSSLLYSFLI